MIASNLQLNEILKKKSILNYASQTNGTRVKCGLTAFGGLTANTAATYDYSAKPSSTWRTHPFSGFLIPEAFSYQYAFNYETVSMNFCTTQSYIVTYASTGARQTIIRRRFVLPIELLAGSQVGNFRFYTDAYNSNTSVGAVYSSSVHTGTTGTLTCTVNFGTIAPDGTKTQISTANHQYTLAALGSGYVAQPINVTESSYGTAAQDDNLYIEVIQDLNQTARSSGSGTIAINYVTGTQLTGTPVNQTWFDFHIK